MPKSKKTNVKLTKKKIKEKKKSVIKKDKKGKRKEFYIQKLSNIVRLYPILKLLCKANSHERQILLSSLNDTSIEAVCTCVLNAVYNKNVVTEHAARCIRDNMKKHQNDIHSILSNKASIATRRQRCVTHHNCVRYLLWAIMPYIHNLYNMK